MAPQWWQLCLCLGVNQFSQVTNICISLTGPGTDCVSDIYYKVCAYLNERRELRPRSQGRLERYLIKNQLFAPQTMIEQMGLPRNMRRLPAHVYFIRTLPSRSGGPGRLKS